MLTEKLERATLVKRYKRFLADVQFPDGQVATIHCPNPGSMEGIAITGSTIWLRPAKPGRKLSHSWVLSEIRDSYVCVDTLMANRLLYEGLTRGQLNEVLPYSRVKKERSFQDSRFDFFLGEEDSGGCYMEVKSTTLAIETAAMFPDAVTERGLKHLNGLINASKQGFRAVQFFCLARQDVLEFRPADHIDVEYGKALRKAAKNNVEILAWTMKIERDGHNFTFSIGARVPVKLD